MAAQGANVTINGFGDTAAIEKERSGIEKEFGVKAVSVDCICIVMHVCHWSYPLVMGQTSSDLIMAL